MSIFSKQIHQIGYDDIRELLIEGAEENIRLEFKQEYPGKSNMLKKLSAFANTYGGYLILGIEEDGRGKVKTLKGIDPIRRFDQTVIQWCFEEIYPPIIPYVSPPIQNPEAQEKFFYVIYVEQSSETPHVLNKSRNGLYVRTDEYSQKFLTRLAKFDELEFLMNKRKKAEDFVNALLERANRRLSTHKMIKFEEHHGTDSLLTLCFIPLVPHNRLFEPKNLIPFAQESALEIRGAKIPDFSDDKLHSQLESIISENPGVSYYSYFEINIYNMLYYVCDITREYHEGGRFGPPFTKVIPLKVLMAEILMFFKYARSFYNRSGFDGMLKLIARMENIKGRKLRFEDREHKDSWISFLDNALSMDRSLSVLSLIDEKELSMDLFRELCFSLGYKNIYTLSESHMEKLYDDGLRYLNWLD